MKIKLKKDHGYNGSLLRKGAIMDIGPHGEHLVKKGVAEAVEVKPEPSGKIIPKGTKPLSAVADKDAGKTA